MKIAGAACRIRPPGLPIARVAATLRFVARSAAGRRPKAVATPDRGRRQPPPSASPSRKTSCSSRACAITRSGCSSSSRSCSASASSSSASARACRAALGDLIRNNGSSSVASVNDAQKKVDANPKSAAARLDLSRAYQTDRQSRQGDPAAREGDEAEAEEHRLPERAGRASYTTQASDAAGDRVGREHRVPVGLRDHVARVGDDPAVLPGRPARPDDPGRRQQARPGCERQGLDGPERRRGHLREDRRS